ncbi:MAG: hypothetical protein JJU18_08065 [Oceanicaulis sp.]|nr:hypothetical protein [Oceanicaulis sp.]
MILAAALAALALDASAEAPGAYTLSAGERSCRIVLDAPSAAPEGSLIAPDGVSGLVLAFPDCPDGLDEAAFWRVTTGDGELVLFDGAGGVLLSAAPGERRNWTGETAAGAPVQLSRR